MEFYKEQINKSETSKKFYINFLKEFPTELTENSVARENKEQIFIEYFRDLSLFLIKDQKIRQEALVCAFYLGRVPTIKMLQRIMDLEPSGIVGVQTKIMLGEHIFIFSLKEKMTIFEKIKFNFKKYVC